MDWKAGDWVTFDLTVGQIKEIRDGGATFSDGHFETSGMLVDRFRSLTLRNKRIVETMDIIYNRLRDINGNAGFNYPEISRYFARLALMAIDDEGGSSAPYDLANAFVRDARDYKPAIDGVALFRPERRAAS